MMCRHFRLKFEFTGAIAKRLPHAKNQLSVLEVSSINSIQIYTVERAITATLYKITCL